MHTELFQQFKSARTFREHLDLASKLSLLLTIFFLPISTTFGDLFFLLTPILMLLAGNTKEKFSYIIAHPLTPVFLALFGFMFISVFYSIAPWHQALATFLKYDKLPLSILMLPLLREERLRNYAVYSFLAAVLFVLCLGFMKFFGLKLSFSDKFGSIDVFKSYIQNSFIAAFAAYLALVKIFVEKKQRLFFTAVFAITVFYVLFLSFGRTGYVVFLAALALFFWQKLRWRGVLLGGLTALIFIATAFIFSTHFRDRIYAVYSDLQTYSSVSEKASDTSVGERIVFQRNSLRLVKEHPLFGVGAGGFRYAYAALQPPPFIKDTNPHNQYLFIAVEQGLFGVILLLLIFLQEWRLSFKLPTTWRYLAQALVLMMMLGSLANSWLSDTLEGHFFCFFSVLIFSALPDKSAKNKRAVEPQHLSE